MPCAEPTVSDIDAAVSGESRKRRADLEPNWPSDLGEASAVREEALAALHRMLVGIARAEVNRRGSRLRLVGPELDDLADQAAADAMVAILAKLDQFRGESRFTTWAYKFVILEVSTKIGRHFWRQAPMEMDADAWDRIPDRFGVDPAEHAQRNELVAALRLAVQQNLTDRQRQVFVALVVDGVPLDALVAKLGSNRNAIYKTLFDARRKLRTALAANDYLASTGEGLGSDSERRA